MPTSIGIRNMIVLDYHEAVAQLRAAALGGPSVTGRRGPLGASLTAADGLARRLVGRLRLSLGSWAS